jgi:hypothetical protein
MNMYSTQTSFYTLKLCVRLAPFDHDQTNTQVDVGSTCDEFMKLLGFESDYVFIRSGHLFHCGSEDRCCIQISEVHKMMQANQVKLPNEYPAAMLAR